MATSVQLMLIAPKTPWRACACAHDACGESL